LLVFSLPGGSLADRYDRRRIITIGTSLTLLLSGALAALSHFHAAIPDTAPLRWANGLIRQLALLFERHADPAALNFDHPALPLMFLLLLAVAIVRILTWPARSSIIPLLLPNSALPNAITWNSSAFEIATVTGPALGGFIIAFGGFPAVYLLDTTLGLVFLWLLRRVRYHTAPGAPAPGQRTWRGVLAGAEFIWQRKVILGASSLDLFATLLGGCDRVTAIYADQVLQVGPIGLGWLRAAPSLGAFAMAFWLAHRAPPRRARSHPPVGGGRLRPRDRRLRFLPLVLAVVCRPGLHRRVRQRERRGAAVACATADARPSARPA
jgi:MFS family permease